MNLRKTGFKRIESALNLVFELIVGSKLVKKCYGDVCSLLLAIHLGFVCEFGGVGRGRLGKKGMSKWKK